MEALVLAADLSITFATQTPDATFISTVTATVTIDYID
jgi:hypothetical protein